MQLLLSVSNALTKWMKLELPRLPSRDGKRVGVQPLNSNEHSLAWQCHVTRAHIRAQKGIVIAVEQRSRYTILMSFNQPPTKSELERELKRCWTNAFIHYALDSGAISEESIAELLYRISHSPMEFLWYRNTDLSVNGHVSDAEQWVKQSREEYRINHLTEADVINLEAHINQFAKRVKVGGKRGAPFYPVTHLVDDGLFRFAQGVCRFDNADRPAGDFPSPYRDQDEKVSPAFTARDNVVVLSNYRKKKNEGG